MSIGGGTANGTSGIGDEAVPGVGCVGRRATGKLVPTVGAHLRKSKLFDVLKVKSKLSCNLNWSNKI